MPPIHWELHWCELLVRCEPSTGCGAMLLARLNEFSQAVVMFQQEVPHVRFVSTELSTGVKPDEFCRLFVTVVLLNAVGEFGHLVVDRTSLFHKFADFLIGVHDCCVISVAE